jgi:hypothetical protein
MEAFSNSTLMSTIFTIVLAAFLPFVSVAFDFYFQRLLAGCFVFF